MDLSAMMSEGSLKMELPMEGLTKWRRSGSFNHSSQFGVEYPGTNRCVSNIMSSEQTVNKRGVNTRKRRDKEDKSKLVSTSNGDNTTNDCKVKRVKASACNNDNDNDNRETKCEAELSSEKHMEQRTKPPLEPPKDYIHVRARRGQATDSHSLAERARREKISERMKILQDLVPGCDRVIGKALVLDEIINYIQSLQRQVEFLSMKLEAVNSMQE